jgi:hypothetical protein
MLVGRAVFLGIIEGSHREIKRIHRGFTAETQGSRRGIGHRPSRQAAGKLTPTARSMPSLKMAVAPIKAKEESQLSSFTSWSHASQRRGTGTTAPRCFERADVSTVL